MPFQKRFTPLLFRCLDKQTVEIQVKVSLWAGLLLNKLSHIFLTPSSEAAGMGNYWVGPV